MYTGVYPGISSIDLYPTEPNLEERLQLQQPALGILRGRQQDLVPRILDDEPVPHEHQRDGNHVPNRVGIHQTVKHRREVAHLMGFRQSGRCATGGPGRGGGVESAKDGFTSCGKQHIPDALQIFHVLFCFRTFKICKSRAGVDLTQPYS